MSKIIDRIVKLRKLATSDNQHEAEQAAAQALKLQMAHAISQADIDKVEQQVADPLGERALYLSGLRLLDRASVERGEHALRVANWKRQLFSAISDYLGLRWTYVKHSPYVWLYGYASDITMAVTLYETCARQIDRQAIAWVEAEYAKAVQAHGAYARSEFNSKGAGVEFRESAVAGLEAKFEELSREAATDTAEGYALVQTRAKQVSDWFDNTYSFKRGSAEGFSGGKNYNSDGYAAGRKLNLTPDAGMNAVQRKELT